MTNITGSFVHLDGERHGVKTRTDRSLMEAAVKANIRGIDGDCGGVCNCATCHVYLSERWVEKLGEPGEMEGEMLDFANEERRPGSRLACQIKLSPELDGLVVQTARR